MYGAFLLACYNSSKESFETVCNIGTGFSEAILEELHSKLKDAVIDKPKPFYSHSTVPKDQPDVWFEPRFVWEVKTADLTLSPRYNAGSDALGTRVEKGLVLDFRDSSRRGMIRKRSRLRGRGWWWRCIRSRKALERIKGQVLMMILSTEH